MLVLSETREGAVYEARFGQLAPSRGSPLPLFSVCLLASIASWLIINANHVQILSGLSR